MPGVLTILTVSPFSLHLGQFMSSPIRQGGEAQSARKMRTDAEFPPWVWVWRLFCTLDFLFNDAPGLAPYIVASLS